MRRGGAAVRYERTEQRVDARLVADRAEAAARVVVDVVIAGPCGNCRWIALAGSGPGVAGDDRVADRRRRRRATPDARTLSNPRAFERCRGSDQLVAGHGRVLERERAVGVDAGALAYSTVRCDVAADRRVRQGRGDDRPRGEARVDADASTGRGRVAGHGRPDKRKCAALREDAAALGSDIADDCAVHDRHGDRRRHEHPAATTLTRGQVAAGDRDAGDRRDGSGSEREDSIVRSRFDDRAPGARPLECPVRERDRGTRELIGPRRNVDHVLGCTADRRLAQRAVSRRAPGLVTVVVCCRDEHVGCGGDAGQREQRGEGPHGHEHAHTSAQGFDGRANPRTGQSLRYTTGQINERAPRTSSGPSRGRSCASRSPRP